MTPKEKAKEIVEKYKSLKINTWGCTNYMGENPCIINNSMLENSAKQCALIAVEEILNEDYIIHSVHSHLSRNEYWQEVKTEIENQLENESTNPKRPTTGKTDEWSPLS